MTTFISSFSVAFLMLINPFSKTTDLHLSTANCLYNEKDRSLEIEIEVYVSNILELFKSNAGELLDLEKGQDQKAAEEFLSDYLALNFMLIQDGKLLRQKFLKMKVVDEKAYLLMEAEVLTPGNLMLKNMLFFEIYPDQINIVKVNAAGNSGEYYFNSKTPEQAIVI